MSSKKLANVIHLSQTVTPHPPYLGQSLDFGLLHLVIMLDHDEYVGLAFLPEDFACPWMRSRSAVMTSLSKHPQLLVFPVLSALTLTASSSPHSHKHQYLSVLLPLGCDTRSCSLTAVSLPNLTPVTSILFILGRS